MIGKKIHSLATRLFCINRSITGDGVRDTLNIIKEELSSLKIFEVPTGTKAFDWIVPDEWKVNDAYLLTPSGKKICEFRKNNLHLVGYSEPIRTKIALEKLQNKLYSIKNQPDAIPYVTSYYKRDWGFCITQNDREKLDAGEYKVFIDSSLFKGNLTYGELIIKGAIDKEVFLSTYVCHPSMANNELSGPTVTTFIAKWLNDNRDNKYTYRIIFIPETIGSIVYLSKNLTSLKNNVVAGFNITCIGDDRQYSYLPSRHGNTLSDKVAMHVLKHVDPNYKKYSWADRGSDERQYCSPGVDLPIASIMRTKYGEYPEYHTSLDDLQKVVTPSGLDGGFHALKKAIEVIENNCFPRATMLCEPQLGKRGLYPNLSRKNGSTSTQLIMDLLTWSDGSNSLLDIAEICNAPFWELFPIAEDLAKRKIITLNDA